MALLNELKRLTLEWCNEIRAEQGKEPLTELPKGKQRDPETCPCGSATGLYVNTSWYNAIIGRDADLVVRLSEEQHALPFDVQRFVCAFDAGEFPELVLKEEGE